MSRIRHFIWPVVALCALVLAPAAQADYHQAIRDCNLDGRLHHQYSQSDIRQAISHLPTDVNEYSDCLSVLRSALTGGDGSGNPSGGALTTNNPAMITPSGAIAGSGQDLNALNALRGSKPPAITIGGQAITPGAGGIFKLASRTAENTLPLPLLLSLLALAAMGALAGLLSLRHRWPETRRVALRLLRR